MDFTTQFYILRWRDILLLLFLATFLFSVLHLRFRTRSWWKVIVGLLWLTAVLGILYITVLKREKGVECQVLLAPFHSWKLYFSGEQQEAFRYNLMNMILFLPYGFLGFALLPKEWGTGRKLALLVLTGCLYSVLVEVLQYRLQCGEAETDDVIHNTVGAFAGAVLSWAEGQVLVWLGRRKKGKGAYHA